MHTLHYDVGTHQTVLDDYTDAFVFPAAAATPLPWVTIDGDNHKNAIDKSDVTDTHFTINGEGGADSITGGQKGDHLNGGNGDDVLIGAQGNDVLKGGNGRDILIGQAGKDTFYGGPGHDVDVIGTGDTVHATDTDYISFAKADGDVGTVKIMNFTSHNTLDTSDLHLPKADYAIKGAVLMITGPDGTIEVEGVGKVFGTVNHAIHVGELIIH